MMKSSDNKLQLVRRLIDLKDKKPIVPDSDKSHTVVVAEVANVESKADVIEKVDENENDDNDVSGKNEEDDNKTMEEDKIRAEMDDKIKENENINGNNVNKVNDEKEKDNETESENENKPEQDKIDINKNNEKKQDIETKENETSIVNKIDELNKDDSILSNNMNDINDINDMNNINDNEHDMSKAIENNMKQDSDNKNKNSESINIGNRNDDHHKQAIEQNANSTHSLLSLYIFFVICVCIAAMFATQWGRTQLTTIYHKVMVSLFGKQFDAKCGMFFRNLFHKAKKSKKFGRKESDFEQSDSGDNNKNISTIAMTAIVEATKENLLKSKSNSVSESNESPTKLIININENDIDAMQRQRGINSIISKKNKKYKNILSKDKTERQSLLTIGQSNSISVTPERSKELFQPELQGGKSYILSASMVQTIHGWLPLRLNWLDWRRLYTSYEDGTSMLTFYDKISNVGPTILVIKDENDYIFGVFISQAWNRSSRVMNGLSSFKFFGGSDTFVFRIYPNPQKYEWTKSNRFFVFCEKDGITIGGGNHPALTLQKNLSCGTSQHSDTYNNAILSKNEDFQCICVEVWGFDEYK